MEATNEIVKAMGVAVKELAEKEFPILKVITPERLSDIIKEAVNIHRSKQRGKMMDELRAFLSGEVDKIRPIQITLPDKKIVDIQDSVHGKFKECLTLLHLNGNLFMSGPAGTGKTTLASQLAKALDLPFAHISCSMGLSEAHLLGRMLFDGEYIPSEFVTAYENGGVFLFDEIDAADANTLLVVNSALANGIISVPNRKGKPTAKKHNDFYCIVAGNTWGYGSVEYQGRNLLDAAFIDRFATSKVEIGYDSDMEKRLIGPANIKLAETLWKMRDKIKTNKLRRIISTRAFVSSRKLLEAGFSAGDIVKTITVGWGEQEISKIL